VTNAALRAAAAPARETHVNSLCVAGGSVLIVLATLCVACSTPVAPRLVARSHETMGTRVTLTASTGDANAAVAAFAAAFAEFDRLDALLSVWKPGSDVLRINAAAGVAPVPVSDETLEVLAAAHMISAWTGGKFDITFGALSDVWKFDHDRDEQIPTDAQIAARTALIDYRAVRIDTVARTAFVERAGMRIHLGGIGKGYAVDRVVTMLKAAGLINFMVQFGGDLYVAGQAGNAPWRLGINDPRGAPNDSFASVELRDSTFSTSGDYERFFIQNGQRYHHILDPDTGRPARGTRSVTIVTAAAIVADGLSTGVFILGPHAGMELVERLPGVEAVIVSEENEVLISSGLRDRVRIIHAPTR
jgi:FAD:protein FMN transferase